MLGKLRQINLAPNPIIVKELRSRMRGGRAFATLTGMLLLLGGVSYALYQMVVINSRYTSMPLSPQVGQTLFAGLVFLELMLVCGITPAVTAGAISGEEEKQTYEMLLATPLRPASILWGKLVSAMSYIFLLLFAAVPMASLVFIFGGVTAREMVKALVVLIITALLFGVLGIFLSALFKRTGRATVVSYVIVLAMLIGPLFAAVMVGTLRQAEPPRWILIPSPISALSTALWPSISNTGGGPFWMFTEFFIGMARPPISQTGIPRPIYHYSLVLFIFLTIVLYLVAARLVQPTRRWRFRWKDFLAPAIVLVLFTGLVAVGYAATADTYEESAFVTPQFNPMVPQPAMAEPAVVERRVVVAEETSAESAISEDDSAQIYSAAIRQVLAAGVDLDGNESDGSPVLYVMDTTNGSVGDSSAVQGERKPLSEPIKEKMVKILADLPAELEWVSSQDAGAAEGTTVVSLGNIFVQNQTRVQFAISYQVSGEDTVSSTYVVEKVKDAWQVIETVGE